MVHHLGLLKGPTLFAYNLTLSPSMYARPHNASRIDAKTSTVSNFEKLLILMCWKCSGKVRPDYHNDCSLICCFLSNFGSMASKERCKIGSAMKLAPRKLPASSRGKTSSSAEVCVSTSWDAIRLRMTLCHDLNLLSSCMTKDQTFKRP